MARLSVTDQTKGPRPPFKFQETVMAQKSVQKPNGNPPSKSSSSASAKMTIDHTLRGSPKAKSTLLAPRRSSFVST